MDSIPSWLQTGGSQGWGDLAATGARLTLSRQQLADEEANRREQEQQQAAEQAAAQSLQRDRLTADILQTKQQQDAANALRQARLQQAGLLGQGRLDAENTRIANEDAFHQGELGNQSAANDLRKRAQDWRESQPDKTTPGDFVTKTDKDTGLTFKIPAENYKQYADDHDRWESNAPPATTKVPGAIFGNHWQDEVPNPALDAYKKSEPKLRNYLARPAAADLKQPTTTGTSALPPSVAPQGYASPPGGGAMVPLPGAAAGLSQSPASKYKSADDVKKAYDAGQLTQEQAVQILQSQFGLE